ncbi:Hypothetical predicted protein [Olea europaea subsp. europaea]|uniref:Uncharacterized protein n=1 Tax=Olea europaea subsp. europaea TaxID=158383 RepID=A0A8S0PK22_OLEEU|nr:Hypothetical predicted protein [Olea europaea subsp. europaea]
MTFSDATPRRTFAGRQNGAVLQPHPGHSHTLWFPPKTPPQTSLSWALLDSYSQKTSMSVYSSGEKEEEE